MAPQVLAQNFSEASRDPRWLRLYLYESSFWGFKSEVQSQRFFFANEGRYNPELEMREAFKAFQNPSLGKFGTLDLPPSCAFPARRKILEKILNVKFPDIPCPDLESWLDRIGADQAYLVFVGAYAGNAASIMGHSFLRLANSKRENQNREGIDLLAQSVGYLAKTNPQDVRALYILKGLFGGYPGYFDIEPHYMKVGLYNNSESRDLWELRIKLEPEEVKLLAEILWEYSFNAETAYFFISKNCSYRILNLLEAVKPEWNLTSKYHFEVLPAETLRELQDQGIAEISPRFRASIQRRLDLKVAAFSTEERAEFLDSQKSLTSLRRIKNPTVLDALLDYWIFENYKVQARLSPKKAEIMEATYQQSAQVEGKSSFQKSNAEIQSEQKLKAPFEGHRPRWMLFGANQIQGKTGLEAEIRSGIHPIWSTDPAYQGVSAIEYLGLSYKKDAARDWNLYRALGLRALTLENFSWNEPDSSWGFHFELTNICRYCNQPQDQLQVSGNYGLAHKQKHFRIALIPELFGFVGRSASSLQAGVSPGLRLLLQWSRDSMFVHIESTFSTWNGENSKSLDVQVGHNFTKDHVVKLQYLNDELGDSAALQLAVFY